MKGQQGPPEESAIHHDLDEEDDGDSEKDCHEDSFEDLPDEFEVEKNSEGDFVLDGGEDVVDPEDDELQVRDDPDDHEYQHVDVPLEAKIQQYLSVIHG